jgi:hypothetical protein
MRLRFFQVANLTPLDDLTVVFGREEILNRPCAIHFVVGTNGSGKSRLLRALAEVFFGLSQQRPPDFPTRLAYDIGIGDGARTLYFMHRDTVAEAVLAEFDHVLSNAEVRALLDIDWQTLQNESGVQLPSGLVNIFPGHSLPGFSSISTGTSSTSSGGYYPSVILVYTSGGTKAWEETFKLGDLISPDEQYGFDNSPTLTFEDERPIGWSLEKENENRQASGAEIIESSAEDSGGTNFTRRIGILVQSEELKLALLAVSLNQAVRDLSEGTNQESILHVLATQSNSQQRRRSGFRGMMDEVDWACLVTVSLHFHIDSQNITERQLETIRALETLASAVVVDPGGGKGCALHFDVYGGPIPLTDDERDKAVARQLQQILVGRGTETKRIDEGTDTTPFDIFRQLAEWRDRGLLKDISLSLRKRNVEDMLLFDWLSDGEQLFLSRMALFHLLQGGQGDVLQDALFLLDEPETHFNDVWKREIVDIIDESMASAHSEVVLTTHSSITLTDVFQDEIQLLQKDELSGKTVAGRVTEPTFGADPSEIMVRVFKAPDSIGQRALEYLEAQIRRPWTSSEKGELENLIRWIGDGYHRSELRMKWRELSGNGQATVPALPGGTPPTALADNTSSDHPAGTQQVEVQMPPADLLEKDSIEPTDVADVLQALAFIAETPWLFTGSDSPVEESEQNNQIDLPEEPNAA